MKELLFIIGSIVSFVVATRNIKDKRKIVRKDIVMENELIKNQLLDQLLNDKIKN